MIGKLHEIDEMNLDEVAGENRSEEDLQYGSGAVIGRDLINALNQEERDKLA